MKSFKQYLPEAFLTELGEGPGDSTSPISGATAHDQPDPTESEDGHRELGIGDPVKIIGRVQYAGCKGVIDSFDGDNVAVNLYKYGNQKFPSANVTFDDYADKEDHDTDRDIMNLRRLSGYVD